MIQLSLTFETQFELDFNQPVELINDIDLTVNPVLTRDTPDAIVAFFYGRPFLSGWLKVKHSDTSIRF